MSRQELHQLRGGFWLGDRWVDPVSNRVGTTRIYSKSMDVLVALADGAPNVVSCASLLDRVWSRVVVVENVVHQAIAQVRKALGDDVHEPRYIESIPRRGYRVVADIRHPEQLLDHELKRERRVQLADGITIELNVRTISDRLRLTMRLVRCSDGQQLWRAALDRQIGDVLVVQREIGQAIASAVSSTLRDPAR